jgi:hypothetical protein
VIPALAQSVVLHETGFVDVQPTVAQQTRRLIGSGMTAQTNPHQGCQNGDGSGFQS